MLFAGTLHTWLFYKYWHFITTLCFTEWWLLHNCIGVYSRWPMYYRVGWSLWRDISMTLSQVQTATVTWWRQPVSRRRRLHHAACMRIHRWVCVCVFSNRACRTADRLWIVKYEHYERVSCRHWYYEKFVWLVKISVIVIEICSCDSSGRKLLVWR